MPRSSSQSKKTTKDQESSQLSAEKQESVQSPSEVQNPSPAPEAQPQPVSQPSVPSKPTESIPPSQITAPKGKKKGCCLGCGIVALVILAIGIIANIGWLPTLIVAWRTGELADFMPVMNTFKNNLNEIIDQYTDQDQESSESSSVKKVTGQSLGKIPYAPIEEDHIATRLFGPDGGVLKAQLPGNVTAYYIMPEGSVIQSAMVSLIPYTQMPSSTKHGELSDEYGTGVQVEVSSSQMGVEGYLVFDTTGGAAAEEGAANELYFNRCDPRFSWFNPYLCGQKNSLPATTVGSKTDTIITPIFNSNFDNLVFVQNTIPTGIDGLIATKIKGGDVFIPQKVDKPLAQKLISTTLSRNASSAQRLEAAGLALSWGITDLSFEQLEALSETDARTYQEYIKALYILAQIREGIQNREYIGTAGADSDDLENLEENFEDTLTYIRNDFFDSAVGETGDYGSGDGAIEATAAVSDAEEMGIEGASEAEAQVEDNINENETSPYGQPDRQSGAGEGSTYTGEEEFDPDSADATERAQEFVDNTLANPNATLFDLMQAWEVAKKLGLESEAQIEQRVMDKAQEMIDEVLNDPNATIPELLKALQLAQLLGLDDDGTVNEKVMNRIRAIIEEKLKHDLSKEELNDIANLCDLLGFSDLAAGARSKIPAAPSGGDCDLVKKTLADYGINECD